MDTRSSLLLRLIYGVKPVTFHELGSVLSLSQYPFFGIPNFEQTGAACSMCLGVTGGNPSQWFGSGDPRSLTNGGWLEDPSGLESYSSGSC
jgi:hypothetical protein